MIIKDIFEERIDKKTFQPQYKVCDTWIPISALYDARYAFPEDEYLKLMEDEYGVAVAVEIKEKLLKNIDIT